MKEGENLKKMVKKIFLLVSLVISTYLCAAQGINGQKSKLETIKMAYVTKVLNLQPSETQSFWSTYNLYLNDVQSIRQTFPNDEIKFDEHVVKVKKNYSKKFLKILKDPNRVNKTFTLERKYRSVLKKELIGRSNSNS
ncbi:hypothetical protein [Rhizosphaericola mali]|uniref:DUF4296 domain-containing protein n=1 Tax=Rhizosphaericola mali TaxID=2545455 RepID=A0A5P2FZZ3_9BACT|nr:hypothetical protein [Rhizosphaericola mali]QES87439.1 hypothetical protein E0W69_001765 [Rhizosphaericola mali]